MLNVLDLFSGIGGFSLGLERTGKFRTIAFCEIDPFCRRVLNKHWPDVPIFGDIRTLTGEQIREKCGAVDVITGGYPCQPFSHAGKRGGHEDDRHLWPAMFEVIKAVRPAWVIGENVAGHITLGLDEVLSDLEALGYACRPFVIPACAVDAPHRRDRVWIVAHTDNGGISRKVGATSNKRQEKTSDSQSSGGSPNRPPLFRTGGPRKTPKAEILAHSDQQRKRGRGIPGHQENPGTDKGGPPDQSGGSGQALAHTASSGLHAGTQPGICRQEAGAGPRDEESERRGQALYRWPDEREWFAQSGMGRVAHGVPQRVDRLRALGNAVVPQVVQAIGEAINEA